ncbi:LytR C-terminal domain-containing protein [Kribbella italica]|uniref:Pyruvate/2-oxoglutarate dehydrogenase complex dihydrolipoamide acyltransferase (E2) component n=1 Tax=Kribbella italica TaxID=1540520 RepID=A0A7W9JF95_9ACTN|nr:LytR C-terminal domain-containing protein [Kribbella italica]MBB5840715.1 pyruvate/2-oxoglutarate dehydrogenase complex dihydrolipoamide acyltransferase (E2) component [Kribbella italica]
MTRKDERGQVLSSLVAVLAVVAIVGGLLVLFGTRGNDSVADDGKPAASTPSVTPSTTPPAATPSEPSAELTTAPPIAPTSAPTSAPVSTPSSVPTPTVAVPPSERPAVEIYNNTGRKGLAQSVGGRANQAGWTVTGADNWHGKIVTSTVYYPAGMQAEAAQLAQDLGIPRIKDALDNMKKDRLTVILTSEYSG